MKTIIKNENLKITYDIKLIIKSILYDSNYTRSRERLLKLLNANYISYEELFNLRSKWYKKHKNKKQEIQKTLKI